LKHVDEAAAKYISRQAVKAIGYLHGKDIVHRDIKLENVLISKDFKIKIIDFGFSTQLPKDNPLLYDFCGTPHYIAPEVIQREGYYGKPADIWALGVLIYRLVVGTFPYKGINEKTLFSKVIKGELKMPIEMSG
jgi:MAP/microtubule affinity-regulating kinase